MWFWLRVIMAWTSSLPVWSGGTAAPRSFHPRSILTMSCRMWAVWPQAAARKWQQWGRDWLRIPFITFDLISVPRRPRMDAQHKSVCPAVVLCVFRIMSWVLWITAGWCFPSCLEVHRSSSCHFRCIQTCTRSAIDASPCPGSDIYSSTTFTELMTHILHNNRKS